MTKILLTRHGHVDGIKPKRFRGRAELALTALGIRQGRALAARIAGSWKPVAVYTSAMGRCVATGAAIGEACGVEASVLEGLTDLDYGQWQMRIQSEIAAEQPDLFGLWQAAPHLVRFPGGELLQDLVARTADALRIVLASHGGATVVLVGHDSVNRALLLQLARPAALGLLEAGAGSVLPERDRYRGRKGRNPAHQRHGRSAHGLAKIDPAAMVFGQ